MRKLRQRKIRRFSGHGPSGQMSGTFGAAWRRVLPRAMMSTGDFARYPMAHPDAAGLLAARAELARCAAGA
ncbi:MAG TPA: hypothetical protein PLX20_01395 [Rhodocyclaceae bacterium]|nr:hypothetical protein [Rhodocyclaceae bacterium]HMV55123.1 hypothetical protein [Rhodocyclaceae bacterium]HMZ84067.1 hypothetical protein [Rhodocyclaceae bacterium]HNA04552.1 hypothetical protein [Rhodocyclaceae bacterium]HNB77621.1 hypothetical protein [Rhodocyclaceae bacterium]